MKRHHYRQMILRLEERMRTRPRAVMAQALLSGLAGYLVLLVVVLVTTALFTAFVSLVIHHQTGRDHHVTWITWLSGGCFLVLSVAGMVRVCWTSFPPPEGYRLSEQSAPELLAMAERVRCRLNAPKVRGIYLVQDYNASVYSRPRFGLFGFSEYYILVGLPYLLAHSPEELETVLAHETGHMLGWQGWLSQWLRRLGRSWGKLAEGRFPFPLVPALARSYSERLQARAAVIRRYFELRADQAAAQASGPQATAQSLFRLEYTEEAMQRTFWPEVWRHSAEEELPPKGVYELLAEAISRPLAPGQDQLVRRTIGSRRTVSIGTHPCLRERLLALGAVAPEQMPPFVPLEPQQAAIHLLEPLAREHYLQLFANSWKAQVIGRWRQRHAGCKEATKRRAQLARKSAEQPLSPKEEWELLTYEANDLGDARAVKPLRQFLERHPQHADASFELGRLLLIHCLDPEGIELLWTSARQSSRYRQKTLGLLQDYYEQQGRMEQLEEVEKQIEQYEHESRLSQNERGRVSPADEFYPHSLTPEQVQRVVEALRCHSMVVSAWLVCKTVRYFADIRCHVLLVRLKSQLLGLGLGPNDLAVHAHILSSAVGPGYLVVIEQATRKAAAKKIQDVPASRIYGE